MKARSLVRAARLARHHVPGRCVVCGHTTVFVCTMPDNPREDLRCARCRSVCRSRHVALVLIDELSPGQRAVAAALRVGDVRVHSADSGNALAAVLRPLPRFSASEFVPDVPLGAAVAPGVTCENLENLSFGDGELDVLITEDVLEHVRDVDAAWREIARVLRPGGWHVFTVPIRFDRPTEVRVDTSGDEDVHLLPPEYHGDPIRGQILAYRTFGHDLFPVLEQHGLPTSLRLSGRREARFGIFNSSVLVSRRSPG